MANTTTSIVANVTQGCAIQAAVSTFRQSIAWVNPLFPSSPTYVDTRKIKVRSQTVEHPFGTLKDWMGATQFLTRALPRVSTEMSLRVLACNLKRMISILGIRGLLDAIKA